MNKLISFRVIPHLHKYEEGKGITLITKRRFLEIWLLGLCFSINLGFHPNY
jgi:hypothetical protein